MRCAVIQMNSVRDVDRNLSKAYTLINQAADKGACLAVLPEMFACLGVKNQFQLAQTRFTQDDVLNTLSQWAKEFKMYLVCGSVPLLSSSPQEHEKVMASCLVFAPDGQCMNRYDKIHLFDVDVADEKGRYRESDTFIPGRTPEMVTVDEHKLGLSICYDLRFPELYQLYQQLGCEVITVPSAFTFETGRKHWEILLRARAIETQCFVLAANQVGVHEDGRRTWGQSMVVSPSGEILVQGDNENEQALVADLDFSELHLCRQTMPIQQHKMLSKP